MSSDGSAYHFISTGSYYVERRKQLIRNAQSQIAYGTGSKNSIISTEYVDEVRVKCDSERGTRKKGRRTTQIKKGDQKGIGNHAEKI